MLDEILEGDCQTLLHSLSRESIDLIVTDPPYGLEFMGKDWDRAVPAVEVWRECIRVLKPGAFAFVMSSPRLDCLSQMAIRLGQAGFNVGFTPIYWAYASGFPKATNISKAVDKRLGAERRIVDFDPRSRGMRHLSQLHSENDRPYVEGIPNQQNGAALTEPASEQAKLLDGSYGGFQPKPAVEVIIVAMKPLSEKTYVDQALRNGKGVAWLDDGRVPYDGTEDPRTHTGWSEGQDSLGHEANLYKGGYKAGYVPISSEKGRFPANLLVSDNTLDDGQPSNNGHFNEKVTASGYEGGLKAFTRSEDRILNDSGSFSRYFDLDAWWTKKLVELPDEVQRVFPFLIVPKASKGERNEGLENLPLQRGPRYVSAFDENSNFGKNNPEAPRGKRLDRHNVHPTVKPLKLMSYLIALGSRKGDLVLDPFIGSGTTALAARILERHYIGIELNAEYAAIAKARLSGTPFLKLG